MGELGAGPELTQHFGLVFGPHENLFRKFSPKAATTPIFIICNKNRRPAAGGGGKAARLPRRRREKTRIKNRWDNDHSVAIIP